MNRSLLVSRLIPGIAVAVFLVACASGPPPRDWQMNAKGSLERALNAYLTGNARVEVQEFQRARGEIAKTGRADLLARAELMRCAARVASLEFDECEGFVKLRADTDLPERAYADYLAARISPQDVALLPPQHREVAAAGSAAAAALQRMQDPLSKLVACGVLFQFGWVDDRVVALAVDTASAEGWRRPLLAWLHVQARRAAAAGDIDAAERLRRRIGLVQGDAEFGITAP
ncbi:MAG: hypothetical protein OEL91_09135 [Burkholderiaceae bacterium]|nr:hypothetical protein [Burkholderiaceae bacterium]